MTPPVEGPATAHSRSDGSWYLAICGKEMMPCGYGEQAKKEAEEISKLLNKALAPLTKKAELCSKMAEAIEDLLMHGVPIQHPTTGEPIPYQSNPSAAEAVLMEFKSIPTPAEGEGEKNV